MAKNKSLRGSQILPGMDKVPQMPAGYYTGDKPNPHLHDFASQWYDDEADDDYDVKPLNVPLETSKATAIYDLHSYHQGKKAHSPIIRYIKHNTEPGDLVLDPFCGSGSTCLAALLSGRSAIGIDRSPAATFITSNYCTPCSVSGLSAAFERVMAATEKEIGWLYQTTSADGHAGHITFTLWSQQFQCRRCFTASTLYDAPEASVASKSGKISKKRVCPQCAKSGNYESLEANPMRLGFIPVATSYECAARPKRRFRSRNDRSKKEAEAFEKYDLSLVDRVDQTPIPYPVPQQRMLGSKGKDWGYLWRPYHEGIETVADFFTHRNQLALSTFLHYVDIEGHEYADRLRFLLSSVLWHASRMSQFKKGGGGIMPGLYYVPPTHKEQNVLKLLRRKFNDFERAYDVIVPESTNLCISTQSSTDLSSIPTNTVDYIFTDPPYADNVQYGEANHLWEAWLGFETTWRDQEIIINPHLGRDEQFWRESMALAMRECFRVLKPGHWLTLCYHDSSEGTWELIQDVMAEVGFVIAPTDKAVYIEARQKSPKQTTTAKATKRDLIMNFRKPRLGDWMATCSYIPKDADTPTFQEMGRQIIRDFLTAHPGTSKDRIYDELVNHMVSRGEMEAHDFDALLRRVAEEVREPVKENLFDNKEPDLFDSHIKSRWYLKETADQIDQGEQDKEDAAAERLEKFMVKHLQKNLEREGVHYSDLFEQVITIPANERPRRLFENWLPEYFFKTTEGTWKPPENEKERQQKAALREAGTLRRMKRFANALIEGVPVREKDRPENDRSLAEWIRQCRRAGLYEQGRALYEKGGLKLEHLNDEEQIEVEDDYRLCVKRGSEDGKSKGKKRK